MKVYIDASAVVKLAATETETDALKAFLDAGSEEDTLFSSALLETEVHRAVRANGLPDTQATQALMGINLVGASRVILSRAGRLPGPGLRSLDAIHLATAMRHGALLMVAYDHRLLTACESVGLPTVSPASGMP